MKHSLGPIITIIVTFSTILMRENIFMYKGTKFDTPQITNTIFLSMIKLIFLATLSCVTWIKLGPATKNDEPRRNKIDTSKYKMM
mmetsp:Transcript_17553/g.19746  ORF Transcript_17553/g.19746 Transcript_17553/m.19746 type:complete len:85 (+) Transcript_17553:233-487(+)